MNSVKVRLAVVVSMVVIAAWQLQANDFIRVVKDSTARFQDVSVAEAEGYALHFGLT